MKELAKYNRSPISLQLLLSLLKDYARPHDKINEMVKAGELTMVKRGLYIPGPRTDIALPHPFLVANHLYGPSYISLEAALQYRGMIPERTYEISSICMKRSARYETPMGRFSFTQVPLPYYSFGIVSEALDDRQVVLIASAEKAICDLIVTTSRVNLRSITQTKEYLFDDLRLDEDMVNTLRLTDILSWTKYSPKAKSIQMLVKTLST